MSKIGITVKSFLLLITGLLCFLFLTGNIIYAIPNDSAKIEGPEACKECHKSAFEGRAFTIHYKSFETMPHNKKAKEIAAKLKIKRIKKEELCISCHFTMDIVDEKEKAIAGISCESCHGAASDWVKVHGDYGGNEKNRYNEAPEHKENRIAQTKASGMIRPNQIYKLAENCYQCHIIPHEKLVNLAGHPSASDFELVGWSQGESRHNFLRSRGQDNEESDLDRLSLMYVAGRAIDLEYSLRGVARATNKQAYAVNMALRVRANEAYLRNILEKVSIPEVVEILEVSKNAKLKYNYEAPLIVAANKISKITRKFLENYDGSEFEALEDMIPLEEDFKGDVFYKD